MLSCVTIAGEQCVNVSSDTWGRSRTKLTHSRTPHELMRRTSRSWNTTGPFRRRRSSAKSAFSSISPVNSTVVNPGRSLMRHESATDSAACLVCSIATIVSPAAVLPSKCSRFADLPLVRRLPEVLLHARLLRGALRDEDDVLIVDVDLLG